MKTQQYIFAICLIIGISIFPTKSKAGNEDRAGSAGATELLINPFAKSSGWAGANTSCVRGIESGFLNIGGMAFVRKTEVNFSSVNYLSGSDIVIGNFGFAQRVSETGVLGFSIMAMNFGEIDITRVELPEGGIGKFSPTFTNVGVSYAKTFSNSIYGGMTFRVVSEQIHDVSAFGAALDAGIQYVTGKHDQLKLGVSMRNVGPKMKFGGDGFSFRTEMGELGNSITVQQRSADFELPSLVNIGASWDILQIGLDSVDDDIDVPPAHRLTLAGNFRSNSFTKDQIMGGVEYGYKGMFMLRAGYAWEKGIGKVDDRSNADKGMSGGLTVQLPINKKGGVIGFDYSIRMTESFDNTHSIGIRLNL